MPDDASAFEKRETVALDERQLVGCACVSLAACLYERQVYDPPSFVYCSNNAFSEVGFERMRERVACVVIPRAYALADAAGADRAYMRMSRGQPQSPMRLTTSERNASGNSSAARTSRPVAVS